MSQTDFQICPDPVSSTTESDSCDCPPEYCCAYICGEGYSDHSYISWQHFPRSTSSRSLCDDSSAEIQDKSISGSTVTPPSEEKIGESIKSSTTEYPIRNTFSQLRALHYLQIRHIYDLLNFLIGHLVCNEPEDPVQFLVNLLGQCIKYRDSFGEPPLLFTHNHVKSLYTAFDPFERGYLTTQQYDEAMRSMGLDNSITPYVKQPPLNEEGHVDESFFTTEANRCLIENLKKILRIPKAWEENRFRWKKRMEKKALRNREKPNDFFEEYVEIKGEEESHECKCDLAAKTTFCQCHKNSEIKCNFEQLFLD